jgi:hypothetical protein
MVLPPPYRGNIAAHLHITRRDASCPRIVSQGLRLGTLSKKMEQNSPKPEVSVLPYLTLC